MASGRRPTRNASEEGSPAFSIYSELGGLPQDPCWGGESSPRSPRELPGVALQSAGSVYCRRDAAHLNGQLFAALSRTNPSRRQTPRPATTRDLISISEMMT
jgi:hypothetical protein